MCSQLERICATYGLPWWPPLCHAGPDKRDVPARLVGDTALCVSLAAAARGDGGGPTDEAADTCLAEEIRSTSVIQRLLDRAQAYASGSTAKASDRTVSEHLDLVREHISGGRDMYAVAEAVNGTVLPAGEVRDAFADWLAVREKSVRKRASVAGLLDFEPDAKSYSLLVRAGRAPISHFDSTGVQYVGLETPGRATHVHPYLPNFARTEKGSLQAVAQLTRSLETVHPVRQLNGHALPAVHAVMFPAAAALLLSVVEGAREFAAAANADHGDTGASLATDPLPSLHEGKPGGGFGAFLSPWAVHLGPQSEPYLDWEAQHAHWRAELEGCPKALEALSANSGLLYDRMMTFVAAAPSQSEKSVLKGVSSAFGHASVTRFQARPDVVCDILGLPEAVAQVVLDLSAAGHPALDSYYRCDERDDNLKGAAVAALVATTSAQPRAARLLVADLSGDAADVYAAFPHVFCDLTVTRAGSRGLGLIQGHRATLNGASLARGGV